MPQSHEYVATLRCQTWNVWPEKIVVEATDFHVEHGTGPIPARLAIVAYLNRTAPEIYSAEATEIGPLVWTGSVPGLYLVRDTILKAPEDVIQVTWEHQHARRGEIDIAINFQAASNPPDVSLLESVYSTASAVMSLINLQIPDYLTPVAPPQTRRIISRGKSSLASDIVLAVRNRRSLGREDISDALKGAANALCNAPGREKLRTALDLYAAHFNERQARVRFLLLVMAMEALAKPTRKHDVALELLGRWERELAQAMQRHEPSSSEYSSLEALSRELTFRGDISIRTQVRQLFNAIEGVSPSECAELGRRALRVYDKRSALVHDGYLPSDEISSLEHEARDLLEKVLLSVLNGGAKPSA